MTLANNRRYGIVLMMGLRLRHRASNKTTLGQCLMVAVKSVNIDTWCNVIAEPYTEQMLL